MRSSISMVDSEGIETKICLPEILESMMFASIFVEANLLYETEILELERVKDILHNAINKSLYIDISDHLGGEN